MPRPAAGQITAVLAVLAWFVCGALATAQQSGSEATRAAVPPLPESALAGLSDSVREQIRERERWHSRLVEAPRSTTLEHGAAYGELGTLYQAYGFLDAAEAAYREAQRIAPGDSRWPYYLGLLFRERNDPENAAASLRRALTLSPEDVPANVRLAEALVDLNRPDEAEPLLERALRHDPDNAAALATLGQMALARGEPDNAVKFLERALAHQPDATSLHAPIAMAYRMLGNHDRASAQLAQYGTSGVLIRDPLQRKLHGLANAQNEHQQRGTAAFEAGRVEEAVDEFRQAVAEDPLSSLPRVNLAVALMRLGRLTDAAQELERAAEIAPDSPRVRFTLGYIRAQQGVHADAVAHYRAAVDADPGHTDAWINLGVSLSTSGRHGDAAAAFAEVVRRRPDWHLPRVREATALLFAGREADARARLDAAAAAMPRDGYVAHALARLLATAPTSAVRDGRRSLAIAESLVQALPNADHAETLAMAFAEIGRFDDAAQWQRRAISMATAGSADLTRLESQLAGYLRGAPVRAPWTLTGELVPIPAAAR